MQTRMEEVTAEDLRGRELFRGVQEGALVEIAKRCSARRLNARDNLQVTRDEVDYIFVIRGGYVAIWMESQFTEGGETFIAWRGPEQVIGETKWVEDKPTHANILACDPCELIEMRRDDFEDAANISPVIYQNLVRLLVKKMEHERCRSEIIRMARCERQVAQTLLHLAHERCGDGVLGFDGAINIPGTMHQDEVAGYTGVKRETINRSLSELKKRNIISYTAGSPITILNLKLLKEIARCPTTRGRRRPSATP